MKQPKDDTCYRNIKHFHPLTSSSIPPPSVSHHPCIFYPFFPFLVQPLHSLPPLQFLHLSLIMCYFMSLLSFQSDTSLCFLELSFPPEFFSLSVSSPSFVSFHNSSFPNLIAFPYFCHFYHPSPPLPSFSCTFPPFALHSLHTFLSHLHISIFFFYSPS